MRILVLHGHPHADSYNRALVDRYIAGATAAGVEVDVLDLAALDFDPVLRHGYAKVQPLEPDLVDAQARIEAADHLVFAFPVWWDGLPALLKGFLDRAFLPGWAFRFNGWWPAPEGLLAGRSARLISTMDAPTPFYRLFYARAAHNSLRWGALWFCGVGPVWATEVGAVKFLPALARRWWLRRLERIGRRDARWLLRRAVHGIWPGQVADAVTESASVSAAA